jgi:hypothetical protein
MTWTLDWGYRDGSSEAPYYLVFRCYPFPRTSWGRTHLTNPIGQITLPGVQKFTRGTSHRYSEDSTMSENMLQALATADSSLRDLIPADGNVVDLREAVYQKLAESAALFQQDTFGHINSTLGRIELLTTEAAFLGSSKRKYNFNWTLRSTSFTANSATASNIGNVFEMQSMPLVGDFADEGTISQMTRMRPPNIWTIEAVGYAGDNPSGNTEFWLGTPKPCVLMQVYHSTDNQAYMRDDRDGRVIPYSYYLSLNFVELENAMNWQNQAIMSRSEYFNQLGGG